MDLPNGHDGPFDFLDSLRKGKRFDGPFQISTNDDRASGQHGHGIIAKSWPNVGNHASILSMDNNRYDKTSKRSMATERPKRQTRLTGLTLENRRRLAKDRIIQGGWKPDITEMAIEYVEARKWNDSPGSVSGVRQFIRKAEDLGELCSDTSKIRAFLNRHIHEFIAFHAWEKDFNVPKYFEFKAGQRRTDRTLKYPWLRSFIREYQGQATDPAESLLRDYREQVDALPASVGTDQDTRADLCGNSDMSITYAPDIEVMDSSLKQGMESPSIETSLAVATKDDKKKRRQTFDLTEGLENQDHVKKVKTEATDDDFVDNGGHHHKANTSGARAEEMNDDRVRDNRKRTLTVLFHGMKNDREEETEHVQVYVPRNCKGVTIHFL
ncbi:hypothetical protein J7T55_009734 [Diaporthe amygdali]|uniref:uncharacterized protein n=1 Tax=Phomopsis amygdali TaxID=1214568 RepID=UPI0022FE7E82|nr:uncharacterized protein J7T55_009734 [Diaporthe amygdali]KAJ0116584.1 hypothetical protein J7T55_009734 [Diaporthe amygdali]